MSALLDDFLFSFQIQPNNENEEKTRKSHLSWAGSSHLFVSVDNVDILPVYSGGGLAWPGLSSAVEKNLSNSDLDIKNTKFFFDVKV